MSDTKNQCVIDLLLSTSEVYAVRVWTSILHCLIAIGLSSAMMMKPAYSHEIDPTVKDGTSTTVLSLVQEPGVASLLEHHRIVVHDTQVEVVARELLTLTQGTNWQTDRVSYLSNYTKKPNGNKDFKQARWLGRWLGSFQTAIREQDLDPKAAAHYFTELLSSLERVSNSQIGEGMNTLAADIANKRITINEAIELLAFGDVTSSSVTSVIAQGIRTVRRNR